MSIPPMEKLLPTEQPQISHSEPSQISAEATLHQISLMARASTLGLSVAPCLLEPSTVHGEALIWLSSWRFVTWPEHVKKRAAERQTLIHLVTFFHGLDPHPERNLYGPTSIPTKPIIQVAGPIHTLIGHRPMSEFLKSFANPSSVMSRCLTYENGLDPLVRTVSTLLVDFGLQSIQILLSKSSRESSEEHSTLKILLTSTMSSLQCMAMDSIQRPQAEVVSSLSLRLSRFDWNSNLSHSSQFRCSFMKPSVRRLHLDNKLPLLLVWLKISLDNLLLESSRTPAFEASLLNELDIMIQSLRNCGYRCVFMLPSSTRPIHKSVKLHPINFLKFPLQNLKTSGIMTPIQCSGGYHNIVKRSTPWPLIFKPQNSSVIQAFLLSYAKEVLHLMRCEVLDASSKSKCQSTKTIHHLPDLLVDVVSTRHLLACGNVPYRSCLQVVALSSKYLIKLSYALIYALKSVVLNVGCEKPLNSVIPLIV